MIEAQRTLVDAQKAYERIAAKYARTDIRLKEDYTKLEETLADAEKNLIKKAEAIDVYKRQGNTYMKGRTGGG